jgi:hypothetical protein
MKLKNFVMLCALGIFSNVVIAGEVVTAAVVFSDPHYPGGNQKYTRHCDRFGCTYIGEEATQFKTVFQNGFSQIVLITKRQLPQDVWYDLTRECDNSKCTYTSVVVSDYQSPETLAIHEILDKERRRPWEYRDLYPR